MSDASKPDRIESRSEEHTSELQSLRHLVCRLLLEKKKTRASQDSREVQRGVRNLHCVDGGGGGEPVTRPESWAGVQNVGHLCAHFIFFFFNDTATTEIYTLSLHDALPISVGRKIAEARRRHGRKRPGRTA